MPSIPTEILTHEIFPKITSVKSLACFRCVSKSFNTDHRHLILYKEHDTSLYSFDIDSTYPVSAKEIPLPKTLFDECFGVTVFIVGSFNGLLCIGIETDFGDSEKFIPVIINPCTSEFREFPEIRLSYLQCLGTNYRVSFGFGFDDINDDYKFVRILENAFRYDYYQGAELCIREVQVFSSKKNKWNLIENVDKPTYSLESNQNGVLMQSSLLHWLFWDSESYLIRCFDVRYDKWANDVPLMDLLTYRLADLDEENKDKVVTVLNLDVLYGCLCVVTVTNLSKVVWIMKEYGVKESWVKLFEISECRTLCHFHGPLGFRQGSKHEVLVRKKMGDSYKLVWCDIESGKYGRTEEIEGVPVDFEGACFLKESAVSIPGGKKIEALADEDHEMLEDEMSEDEMSEDED